MRICKSERPVMATPTPCTCGEVNPVALNSDAAADYLGIGHSTIKMWRSRGSGPAYAKIGTSILYRIADLDAWLAERVVTPDGGDK